MNLFNTKMLNFIKDVLKNQPSDWLRLTTHRLDIYNEELAKTEFLEQFDALYKNNDTDTSALSNLPTAFDYIRLGHPLSCVLEWAVAKQNNVHTNNVISFASKTTPILAILRKNLLSDTHTQICYTDSLPEHFDPEIVKSVYGYHFELNKVASVDDIAPFDGSTLFISQKNNISEFQVNHKIDFYINMHASLGSIMLVTHHDNDSYVSEIQHVRRRESIAMTPANCHAVLLKMVGQPPSEADNHNFEDDKASVTDLIKSIAGTDTKALVASSGLSIQYAILMGLIDDALETHPGKAIKIIVPPNCYGGTNDQARRVAACIANVEVVDLPVDGGK